jgi:hypothetical protein
VEVCFFKRPWRARQSDTWRWNGKTA